MLAKPYNAIEELTSHILTLDARLSQEGKAVGVPASVAQTTAVSASTVQAYATPAAPKTGKATAALYAARKNLLEKEKALEKEEAEEAEGVVVSAPAPDGDRMTLLVKWETQVRPVRLERRQTVADLEAAARREVGA